MLYLDSDILDSLVQFAIAPVVGAAIIGGIASILGGIFGSSSKSSQERQNYQYSRQLAQYQAELQKEQFDYTNEYNLPKNIVQRLRDAQLNPNLAYGSGSVVGSTASMPSVSQPHMNMTDPMAMAQYQLQMAQSVGNIMTSFAQTKKLESEKKGQDIKNEKDARTLDYEVELANYLAGEKSELYEIAKDNRELKRFEVATKRDSYNVMQLITRGLDGDFRFGSSVQSPEQVEAYLRDLQESELYNSTIAVLKRDKLTNDELNEKIRLLQFETANLPLKLRELNADLAVKEYKANLAKAGINPDDPLWARVILSLLGTDNVLGTIKKVGNAIVKPFGGNGPAPTLSDPYLDW